MIFKIEDFLTLLRIMKNRELKDLLVYFINALSTSVLSIVTIKIFGLFIKPETFGLYSIIFNFYNLVALFSFSMIIQSIIRFLPEINQEKNNESFLTSVIFLIGIISLAVVIITIPVIYTLNKINVLTDFALNLLILFSLLYITQGFSDATIAILRAKRKSITLLFYNVFSNISKVIIFLVLFFLFDMQVYSIVLAMIIVNFIGSLMLVKYWGFSKKSKFTLKSVHVKKIVSYGLPLVLLPVINWILATSDQLIIRYYWGDEIVGLYSMGYRISSSLFSLTTSFIIFAMYPFIVQIYNRFGAKETENVIRKISNIYFLVALPLMIVVLFYPNIIIQLLSSNEYIGSSIVLQISSVGFVLLGFISYTNKPLELTSNTRYIFIFSLIGAILNIVLNLIFIPNFGIIAASSTTVISYFIIVILSALKSKNHIIVFIKKNEFIKHIIILFLFSVFLSYIPISKRYHIEFIKMTLTGVVYVFIELVFFRNEIKDYMNSLFKKDYIS